MYEPKYKLNRTDEQRYQVLLIRHCCAVGKKPSRKHPPLTPAESLELMKLEHKLRRKLRSRPGMREYYRKQARRARYLTAKCKRLMDQLQACINASGYGSSQGQRLPAAQGAQHAGRVVNRKQSKGRHERKAKPPQQ